MSAHELAGKDMLERGAVVFCTCGGAFYAPFGEFNFLGTVQPGDTEAGQREADKRFAWHLADVNGTARINPVIRTQQ